MRFARVVQVLAQDDEFVAVQPGQGRGSEQHTKAPGQGDQQGVAGGVPESIVDGFEAVQIDVQHRSNGIAAAAAVETPGSVVPAAMPGWAVR